MKRNFILPIIILVFSIASCTSPETKDKKLAKDTTDLPEPKVVDNDPFLANGAKLVRETKLILGTNLTKAMVDKGAVHALEFCHTKATILTDSLTQDGKYSIKRVSDKNRNPKNTANELELSYIKRVKESIVKSEKVDPQIQEIDGNVIAYYPILTGNKCLQCHGQPSEEIKPNVATKLAELYPEDKAINYKAGELRGIWVVNMGKR